MICNIARAYDLQTEYKKWTNRSSSEVCGGRSIEEEEEEEKKVGCGVVWKGKTEEKKKM